jgi:hypothetical protein
MLRMSGVFSGNLWIEGSGVGERLWFWEKARL